MPDQEVKSISEQIIEDVFKRLKKSEFYNEAVIIKLQDIASKGKLTAPKTIIDAISMSEE